MRQIATIRTTYTGTGTDKDPYRPLTFDILAAGESAEDVTGTPVEDIPGTPAVTIRMRADKTRIDVVDSPQHRVLSREDVAVEAVEL